jgi:hypothetical protein
MVTQNLSATVQTLNKWSPTTRESFKRVGAEMDWKSRGNKLNRAEGVLTDVTGFHPLYA